MAPEARLHAVSSGATKGFILKCPTYALLLLKTLQLKSINHSTYVATITFPDTFYHRSIFRVAPFIISSHLQHRSVQWSFIFRGLQDIKRSTQPFLVSLFISHELTEIKSLSERGVVQQIKTNVGAFCSRSQHILTCGSHYITRWKWPEMHVRLNQLAAQPLVQLRSWVGAVSVVCSVVSTGSQRSSKCWNQLSCGCHLSLSNG